MERNSQVITGFLPPPRLVIYDDGTVIADRSNASSSEGAGWPYCRRRVVDPKSLVERRLAYRLPEKRQHYELTTSLHEDVTVLWTPLGFVSVYGDWRGVGTHDYEARIKATTSEGLKRRLEEGKAADDAFPRELQRALLRLEEERQVAGPEWLPRRLEMILRPYEGQPPRSVPWPKRWPGLGAPATDALGWTYFTVAFPAGKRDAVESLLKQAGVNGAVKVGDKFMTIDLRIPFPAENIWRKSLSEP